MNYIGDVDFSPLYFAPVVAEKSRKSVSVYYNNKNTTWANRMAFQLCEDEDSPVIAKYGLSDPQEDQDPTRLNLTVLLDSTTHKSVIDKLHEVDKIVKGEACKKTKEGWKKEHKPEVIDLMHKGVIDWDNERECYRVKVKVIVPHPKPESGKKYSKPTVIYRLTESGDVVKADHTILTQGAQLVPSVSSVGVWFLGDNAFGVSLKADIILCKPVVIPTPLEQLKLKRKYKEIEPEPEASTSEAPVKAAKEEDVEHADVILGDEDGSAM